MRREDIDKAAVDSCVIENSIFNPELTPYYEQGFKDGANWRINSVWHDINEMPEDGRIIVLLGKYGTMLIYGPNMMYYKESVIMDGGFLKWAYKEDLMPNIDE